MKPLVQWVNHSLRNAVTPQECKVAKVRPVYKGIIIQNTKIIDL